MLSADSSLSTSPACLPHLPLTYAFHLCAKCAAFMVQLTKHHAIQTLCGMMPLIKVQAVTETIRHLLDWSTSV